MIKVAYLADEFCRTCSGKGRFMEPDTHSYSGYRSIPCFDCSGTGWRPGAKIDAQTGEVLS